MIKSFIAAFLRFSEKNAIHFLINLLGLSVAVASTLLIMLYVNDELSFNKTHTHRERIFRIDTRVVTKDISEETAVCPWEVGEYGALDFLELAQC